MLTLHTPAYKGLRKIISGGQIGADQAGIIAAADIGLETGGTAPLNYRIDGGTAPWLAKHGLVQDASFAYPPRTKKNVQDSDGTLIVASNFDSPGVRLTIRLCLEQQKPFFKAPVGVELDDEAHFLAQWLEDNSIEVLNVAGNRDKGNTIVFTATELLLKRTAKLLQDKGFLIMKEQDVQL